MPDWRLFYHLVWSSKNRIRPLNDAAGAVVARSIRTTCEEPAVRLFAVGMMPNHVRGAISSPPRLALGGFVGRLIRAVGGADQRPREERFSWQGVYGALSFGEKNRPDVVAYVRNQPARHAANKLWLPLEQTPDLAHPPSGGVVG